MTFQTKAKLIKNIAVAPEYCKMLLYCPQLAKKALPGQFIEVKVSDSYELLLRRPFSVHRVKGDSIEILFEIVGKGTEILSKRKTGDYLDIIGPLGNGFDYSLPAPHSPFSVLVAGGMGVAPLVYLAEKIFGVHKSRVTSKPLVLIGARNKKHILCEQEFKKLGCEVKIATDDGSSGFKGYVTDLLRRILLTAHSSQLTTVYACGPKPMLKEVAAISKKYNIPAQVSLEAHMACGIGACLGCVVNTIDGYRRVCKEGPVFNSKEIIW